MDLLCSSLDRCSPITRQSRLRPLLIAPSLFLLLCASAFAHGVAEGDKGYIQEITGVNLLPFVYLGAKHMVTGYDHLLFLFGVIFFLYRLQHVALYVSLFAIGHSVTLLAGVYFGSNVSAYLIDAIIGLSVVYKALDNLGAFQRWFGVQPDTRRLWCSACSTASAWRPRSRSTRSRPTDCCQTCWRSMSVWRSGSCLRSQPS